MRHIVTYSDALEFEKTAGPDHLNTLELAINQAQSNIALNIQTILRWHSAIFPYGGQLRNGPVIINGSTTEPPPPYLVAIQLQALVNKINDTSKATMNDIAKWHEEFTAIHPFCDGNGRVSRIMLNYLTVKFGHGLVCLPASERNMYLDCLRDLNIGKLAKLFKKYLYAV